MILPYLLIFMPLATLSAVSIKAYFFDPVYLILSYIYESPFRSIFIFTVGSISLI